MQTALLCGCGSPVLRGDLCTRCARRARHSREKYDGLREAALQRDGYQCQLCGSLDRARLVVHHRRPGFNRLAFLVTLCRACHVRTHRTWRPGYVFAVDAFRWRLWREANREIAAQTVLSFSGDSVAGVQPTLFGVEGAGLVVE